VKIGQLLAIYGESLLPSPIIAALLTLNDQTAHLSWPVIEAAMKQEIGAGFDQFHIDPCGGKPEVIFARHRRWGEGVRAAVRAWGLPTQCADQKLHSPVLTGVVTPPGFDADAMRTLIHRRFDLSLGTGLGKVKGRMFRIGHLGDCNDLTLMAALSGVEMGLKLAGVRLAGSGVVAAMERFAVPEPAASAS
jgi:alanine-glyoxylate transaminase / serine-glyoxylate transaminase / serine-pyruvate transaminase